MRAIDPRIDDDFIRPIPERDDNIRPVHHQIVHFTKTDLVFWIATAVGALAALYAVAELLKGTP